MLARVVNQRFHSALIVTNALSRCKNIGSFLASLLLLECGAFPPLFLVFTFPREAFREFVHDGLVARSAHSILSGQRTEKRNP
jgi:hypothetical protein